jgi:hypothetical protein
MVAAVEFVALYWLAVATVAGSEPPVPACEELACWLDASSAAADGWFWFDAASWATAHSGKLQMMPRLIEARLCFAKLIPVGRLNIFPSPKVVREPLFLTGLPHLPSWGGVGCRPCDRLLYACTLSC